MSKTCLLEIYKVGQQLTVTFIRDELLVIFSVNYKLSSLKTKHQKHDDILTHGIRCLKLPSTEMSSTDVD